MKVCHITTVHPSKDVRIFLKECKSLSKAGYNVTLLAANAQTEEEDGVQIIGVPCPTKSRLARIKKTPKAVYHKALELDADIYHFHDPEFLPYAVKLVKRGKKVVYDVHEDVPRQIKGKYWIPAIFRGTIASVYEKYENKKAKQLSYIVAATPTIRDRFKQFNANVVDVCNYPMLEELEGINTAEKENSVCYIGSITKVRGIVELVEAMSGASYRLNLAGKVQPTSLREGLVKEPGWQQINELGFLDRKEVKEVLARSRVGIVTLHPIVNYLDALPVKMFEYMAAGLPVVASEFPIWKSIIEENDCGICVNPMHPHAIRAALDELINNPDRATAMGERGRKAVWEKYNWSIEEQKLLKTYKALQ